MLHVVLFIGSAGTLTQPKWPRYMTWPLLRKWYVLYQWNTL